MARNKQSKEETTHQRRVHKMGKTWGERLTEKSVWHVVREYAAKAGIDKLAPHDLRRYAESRIMPNRL